MSDSQQSSPPIRKEHEFIVLDAETGGEVPLYKAWYLGKKHLADGPPCIERDRAGGEMSRTGATMQIKGDLDKTPGPA